MERYLIVSDGISKRVMIFFVDKHTVNLGTRMNNAALGMSKHGMVAAVFLAEMCLLVLAFNDIVNLHAVITL